MEPAEFRKPERDSDFFYHHGTDKGPYVFMSSFIFSFFHLFTSLKIIESAK